MLPRIATTLGSELTRVTAPVQSARPAKTRRVSPCPGARTVLAGSMRISPATASAPVPLSVTDETSTATLAHLSPNATATWAGPGATPTSVLVSGM